MDLTDDQMKTIGQIADHVLDGWVRVRALDAAVAITSKVSSIDLVLERALVFEAYIRGETEETE